MFVSVEDGHRVEHRGLWVQANTCICYYGHLASMKPSSTIPHTDTKEKKWLLVHFSDPPRWLGCMLSCVWWNCWSLFRQMSTITKWSLKLPQACLMYNSFVSQMQLTIFAALYCTFILGYRFVQHKPVCIFNCIYLFIFKNKTNLLQVTLLVLCCIQQLRFPVL